MGLPTDKQVAPDKINRWPLTTNKAVFSGKDISFVYEYHVFQECIIL